jgi:type IV secretory pathway TraG/TraD family ATPase VirD4
MTNSASKAPARAGDLDWALIGVVLLVVGGCLLLWVGGQAASLLTGNGFAAGPVTAGVRALLADRDNPAAAWDSAMPDAPAYWWITGIVTGALLTVGAVGLARLRGGLRRRGRLAELASRPGMATSRAITAAVGSKRLRRSAPELRPALTGRLSPEQLGWCWGTARGVRVWTSVRDSVVLLGPSGAGKGVYVVNNRILDAPGAVVATSTRPDVLSVTISQRRTTGPVAVIAADGSMDGLPEVVRWSPIQGCRDGRVAAARAQVLAAGSSTGVEDASFWQGWSEKVIKTLLHAAAWSGAGVDELWRWSQSAVAARSALAVLQDLDGRDAGGPERVEPGWADTLAQVVDGDEKFRGNVWAGVGKALAGLDLSAVRRRFDPRPGENFDADEFLALRGTLYLLAEADDPASRLLQCLVADITRTAKDLADHSLRSRLDPPLTLVLDEIANWAPLPALPTYVSAYGGSGIVTIAVIQSRAQMARSWGSDAAKAIWDSATITGILGGVTDAENLRDFVAIAGDRDETSWQASTGKGVGVLGFGAGRSYSEQTRTRAVLTTGEIRGLPEGTMLMFYKGLDPMLVRMTAYYRRKDRKALLAGRERVEATISPAGAAHPIVAEPVKDR